MRSIEGSPRGAEKRKALTKGLPRAFQEPPGASLGSRIEGLGLRISGLGFRV